MYMSLVLFTVIYFWPCMLHVIAAVICLPHVILWNEKARAFRGAIFLNSQLACYAHLAH